MTKLEAFNDYMVVIVEPTFMDYHAHPGSTRLAFLACVAVYHSIDRFKRKPGNLREEWRKKVGDVPDRGHDCASLKGLLK